jgi:hypothetical protein
MWGNVWNPRFWGFRNGFTPGPDNIILFFFYFFLLFLAKNKKIKIQTIKFKKNKKYEP